MENEEQKKEEYLNKNITLFLYEKVKNGKLDPKYVPDKYLEAIKILLEEEKKIIQNKISSVSGNI